MHLVGSTRKAFGHAASVIGLSLALLCGGCLVSSHSEQKRSGNYVSDSTLNQIQPGNTTESWVRATLGPPTVVDELGNDSEIWKYRYSERRDSSGSVFLLFAGSDTKETTGTVFIEFHRGVVTRTWRS